MVKRSRSQRGGEYTGRTNGIGPDDAPTPPMAEPSMPPQAGGDLASTASPYGPGPGGFEPSQYRTITGGSRRRRKHGKKHGSKRKHRKHKGGNTVLATAAVPFGLLALQRYFKGSKTSKKGVAKMGRSFKRTFRRRY
jgi:hypothetical protein